jgi:FxsC-like protein
VYFFLSYARDDRKNDELDVIGRFHGAIVNEIRRRKGVQDDVAFFDTQDLAPGEDWRAELREALATSSAFVPVLSRTYFSREYCGKEWAVFRSRLRAYSQSAGKRPPLILPVLLDRRQDLTPFPKAVADEAESLQTTYDLYPEVYGVEGLHFMARLGKHKDDLNEFIIRFAQRLIEVVEADPLPRADDVPPIKELQSAFHEAGTQLGVTTAAPPPIGKFAQFVYVAGRQTEVAAIRNDVTAYGSEGGLDWQPFRPGVEDEVAILAQEVTSREKLRYEAVPVDAELTSRLEQAAKERKVVVVIADAWTLGLDEYGRLMKELDRLALPNCVVLVPWNPSDPETTAKKADLENVVKLAFENRSLLDDPNLFLDGISSCTDLQTEVSKAFARVRTKLIAMEDVRRRAAGGTLIPKPEVTGPGKAAA